MAVRSGAVRPPAVAPKLQSGHFSKRLSKLWIWWRADSPTPARKVFSLLPESDFPSRRTALRQNAGGQFIRSRGRIKIDTDLFTSGVCNKFFLTEHEPIKPAWGGLN